MRPDFFHLHASAMLRVLAYITGTASTLQACVLRTLAVALGEGGVRFAISQLPFFICKLEQFCVSAVLLVA